MKKLQKGDRVAVLDDDLKGTVVKVTDKVLVLMEDGFEMQFEPSELVKESHDEDLHEAFMPSLDEIEDKEEKARKKQYKTRPKRGEQTELVIDLHIEKLVKSTKGLNPFDMLTKQLDTAKYHLELAMRKRLQKVVFIHGIGDGVLRADLESLFRRYEDIRFYDADYRKYGQGAVEVYIPQNAFS